MDAPLYVWNLLEKELEATVRAAQEALLKKVACRYQLDEDTLLQEFLPAPPRVQLLPQEVVQVQVIKRNAPRRVPEDTRCWARVWNRGKGGRCQRCRMDGSDFCRQHLEHRKHGDAREKVSRELYPTHRSALYH